MSSDKIKGSGDLGISNFAPGILDGLRDAALGRITSGKPITFFKQSAKDMIYAAGPSKYYWEEKDGGLTVLGGLNSSGDWVGQGSPVSPVVATPQVAPPPMTSMPKMKVFENNPVATSNTLRFQKDNNAMAQATASPAAATAASRSTLSLAKTITGSYREKGSGTQVMYRRSRKDIQLGGDASSRAGIIRSRGAADLIAGPSATGVRSLTKGSKTLHYKPKDDFFYSGGGVRQGMAYGLEELHYNDQSISSVEALAMAGTSEQIAGARLLGAGPQVAAAFVKAARRARDWNMRHTGFATSTDPTERLYYMAGEAGLSLKHVISAIGQRKHSNWETNAYDQGDPDDPFSGEQDFNEVLKGVYSETVSNPGDPKRAMLRIFGRMTIGKADSAQDILEADLITPEKEGLKGRWYRPAKHAARAANLIASQYISPDLQGDARATLQGKIAAILHKTLPQALANTGFDMVMRGEHNKPIGWLNALPTPEEMKSRLSESDRLFINPKLNKRYDRKRNLHSSMKNLVKRFAKGYERNNEGGLQRIFDPTKSAAKYALDELGAAGVDNIAVSRSMDPTRENSSGAGIGSDAGDALAEALAAQGATSDDLRRDPAIQATTSAILSGETSLSEIAAASMGLDTDTYEALIGDQRIRSGATDVSGEESIKDGKYETKTTIRAIKPYVPSSTFDPADSARRHRALKQNLLQQEAIGEALVEMENAGQGARARVAAKVLKGFQKVADPAKYPVKVGVRMSQYGNPLKISMNANSTLPAAPAQAPAVGSVVQTGNQQAAAQQAQAAAAGMTAEQSKELFFKRNPNIMWHADDDDKRNPMSMWQRLRRGILTSSGAYELADPEKAGSALKSLIKGATTSLKTPANIYRGSVATQAGDALEPHILDHYRNTIDASAFSPGLLTREGVFGQGTTPDALAQAGKRVVEVKTRNKFLDHTDTELTKAERETLTKNYAQMQHQMYITGAKSGHLLEVIRDPLNPNKPLGRKGFDSSNFRKHDIERDEDYIQQMKPIWDRAGIAAEQISSLSNRKQQNLAKAVEEGNIASFEKLAKKYGIEGASELSQTMGLLSDGTVEGAKKARGGGGGGGGGRSNWGGLAGRDAPQSLGSAIRGILAESAGGRVLNTMTAAASIAWTTMQDVNKTGLEESARARAAGMQASMFRGAATAISNSRYMSYDQAAGDLTHLSLAQGGAALGEVGRLEQIVIGTRGALNVGDVMNVNLKDKGQVQALYNKAEKRLRQRFGNNEAAIASAMEMSGLSGILSDTEATEGQRGLNESVNAVEGAIVELKGILAAGLGELSGVVTDGANAIVNAIQEYGPGGTGSYIGNLKKTKSAFGIREQMMNPVEAGSTSPTVPNSEPPIDASNDASPSHYKPMFRNVMGFSKDEAAGYWEMMRQDPDRESDFIYEMNKLKGANQDAVRSFLSDPSNSKLLTGKGGIQDAVMAGKLDITLTTQGVEIRTSEGGEPIAKVHVDQRPQ